MLMDMLYLAMVFVQDDTVKVELQHNLKSAKATTMLFRVLVVFYFCHFCDSAFGEQK